MYRRVVFVAFTAIPFLLALSVHQAAPGQATIQGNSLQFKEIGFFGSGTLEGGIVYLSSVRISFEKDTIIFNGLKMTRGPVTQKLDGATITLIDVEDNSKVVGKWLAQGVKVDDQRFLSFKIPKEAKGMAKPLFLVAP